MNAGTKPEWPQLLVKLQAFDAAIAPLGLYAAEEHQMQDKPRRRLEVEWGQCLKPAMKAMGCNPVGRVFYERDQASIEFQQGGTIGCLKVIRLSKIKVRRYGSAYRVDPHHDFSTRWKDANLGGALNRLEEYHSRPGGLLLFLGFAVEAEPFASEIDELQAGSSFQQRFSNATTRTWDDPHGRGFKVLAALWHVTANNNSK
ncbi:MAG: hypothetical protein IPK15_09380 [Verrucomicrobia bacterium]|nr:hypothetical protein [Verrucomicrobiota bacterium]